MLTLRGRILDVRDTRLLMAQGELNRATTMLLDKVQKGQRIAVDDAKRLEAAKLVEACYPSYARCCGAQPHDRHFLVNQLYPAHPSVRGSSV
jgi:hypothetical protein